MNERDELRQRLLELEPMEGSAFEHYRAELAEMLNRKLSLGARLVYLVPLLGGGGMALLTTSLAVSEPDAVPMRTRLAFLLMAAIGLVWVRLVGRVLRRGSVNLLSDRRAIAVAALLFSVLQSAFFGWRASVDPGALPGLVLSLVCVVLAVGVAIQQRVREAELRTREQQIALELARGR